MRPRPPLLPRLLLRVLLPSSLREAFLGDLEEQFHRRVAHDGREARRAYWREALSPSLFRLRKEARGMPLPPGARPGSASGDHVLSQLLQDLRYALRLMAKAPGFTAVAVISLALGIGPNTAIFSLVDRLLLTEWGVHDPATVMDIYSLTDDGEYFYTYYRVKELVEEGAPDAFTRVGASAQYTGHLEVEGESELVLGELVTGNYFDLLGVEAAAGRTFLPEEDATPGTHPVVVVSDRYWRTRHGADPALVGSELRLNGRPYTVVGIAPPEFRGRIAPGIGTDFWVPLRMYPHLAPNQMGNGNLLILGRLAPGMTADQARARLDAVATRFNEERPEVRSQLVLGAVTLDEIILHPNFDGFLLAVTALLFVAVGLVLLVACVNLAGFLLSRATERRKEMAVRVAMGAGRGDLVRQLLMESLVLAAVGGALGLALGQGVLQALLQLELPVDLPLQVEAGLNARVLLFTGAAALVAAVAFGLTPALEATRTPVAATLRDEAGTGGRGKRGVRGLLVAGQMALSTVLLVVAGLFLRSLQVATSLDVGFDTGPAAVVTVEAWASDLTSEERTRFAEDYLTEVRNQSGVTVAGITSRLPLDLGVTNTAFQIPGVEPPPNADAHVLEFAYATEGYLEAMGIGVVEGRDILSSDRADAQRVVVVSRAMAERYWPGESALGRTLYRTNDPENGYVVVGVAEDAKIWSLTEPPRPYVYMAAAQGGGFGTYRLVARVVGPPAEAARELGALATRMDPRLFVSGTETMNEHLAYIYFLPRMGALLLALVGSLAVTMACIGLYGMVSYSVARRTREMGIRLALGAERGRVVTLVVRSGLAMVAFGAVIGLAVASGTSFLVEGLLVGVPSLDPLALLGAPLALGTVASLAAYLPARRAARVDPVEALRTE